MPTSRDGEAGSYVDPLHELTGRLQRTTWRSTGFAWLGPDLTRRRVDLLAEENGPTLVHGIQSLHGQRIGLPRSLSQRPDLLLAEARYAEFGTHAQKAS